MLKNASQAPTAMQRSDGSIVSVCVECTKKTKSNCIECGLGYCESCFVKVHSAGVVFKKHQLKHLDTKCSAIGSPLGPCNAHNKKLSYYCQNCSTPICGTCASTSHGMHNTKELVKVVSLMIILSSICCYSEDDSFVQNEKVCLNESLELLKQVRDMIEESRKVSFSWINFILIVDRRLSIKLQPITGILLG